MGVAENEPVAATLQVLANCKFGFFVERKRRGPVFGDLIF